MLISGGLVRSTTGFDAAGIQKTNACIFYKSKQEMKKIDEEKDQEEAKFDVLEDIRELEEYCSLKTRSTYIFPIPS